MINSGAWFMSLEGGEYVEGTNAVFQSDQFCVAGFSLGTFSSQIMTPRLFTSYESLALA